MLVSPVYPSRSPQNEAVTAVVGQERKNPGSTVSPVVTSPSSSAAASTKEGSLSSSAAAGLTIETTSLQAQYNGRDPTPYHYRSYPSTSPNHFSGNTNRDNAMGKHENNEDKKLSDASSRSGRDPPATSANSHAGSEGNITVISTHGQNHHTHSTGSTIGFVTSKSTPNLHSHHYQNKSDYNSLAEVGHHNELSMIEEDGSLVSNVTGSTFVRTPIVRKLHGNHNNHHTPKNTYGAASTTTASIHATPSTSQLLYRPSLAMRESLSHIATMTSHALEEIWDCVGVAPDERASQLTDLVERIGQLCEMKVQEEEALRDQFRKEISEARKEWEDTCASLMMVGEEDPVAKLKRDPSTKDLDGGGVSLQCEYEAMMGRLESLRTIKQSAMADMQSSRSRIYQAYAALNSISVQEASQANEMLPYSDIETNLTHERREEFRNKAQTYEESVLARTRAVVSLVLDCQTMIRELDIVPPTDEVSFGRSEDDFKIMNSLQPIEDDGQSTDSYGGAKEKSSRDASNKYTITNPFESSTCIGIGNSALDRLTSRIAELNGEKRRRRAKLAEMGSAISSLWTMLRVTADEQRAFTMSIRGLGLDTIRKGEAEIARLDEIKGVMIGKLVKEQRAIIEDLWNKTNLSANERASFDIFFQIQDDDQLTSDILRKHEDYAASLKDKLHKMQPILNLITKREAILEERTELELLQKDPDRLKGRGATKQLMKEEKMSRRVTKELPKITSILEETLRQWYVENKPSEGSSDREDGHFMYNGSPYLRTMHWQEEDWRTRKERNDEERHRKRQEERDASSSGNSAFGTTYMKLPGRKWNPSIDTNTAADAAADPASSRPRSASTARSAANLQPGGSHPSDRSNNNSMQRSGSNLRLGGRGPLGEVSNRQNTSTRPPSRPRGTGEAGPIQVIKKTSGGHGFRPSSAPRTRL